MILQAIQFPNFDPFVLGPIFIGNFPLGLRWYSLAYIVGLLGGIWLAGRMIRAWAATVDGDDLDALFIWFVVGVVLGGRLFFVLFYGLTTYPQAYASPANWIRIWDGGMSFHGGMFGVGVVVIIYGLLKNGLRTFELADYVAAVAPIGLFLGRISNFVNGELWGRPTEAPWGMLFPRAVLQENGFNPASFPGDSMYAQFQSIIDQGGILIARHPSQLYEAIFEGIVLFIIVQVMIRTQWVRQRSGTVAGAFIMGYGVFRWTIEWFRQPDGALGILNVLYPGSTMGQLLSLPMIFGGTALLFWAMRQLPHHTTDNIAARGA